MSLFDDLNEWYQSPGAPPLGNDDYELVSEKPLSDLRWGTLKQWVFTRDDEYVAVEDVEPATEMQDWGDYGEPMIYRARPEEVITIEFRRIEE